MKCQEKCQGLDLAGANQKWTATTFQTQKWPRRTAVKNSPVVRTWAVHLGPERIRSLELHQYTGSCQSFGWVGRFLERKASDRETCRKYIWRDNLE